MVADKMSTARDCVFKVLRNTSTYLITKGNFISFHYRLDFVRTIAQQIRQREYNDGFSFYWH